MTLSWWAKQSVEGEKQFSLSPQISLISSRLLVRSHPKMASRESQMEKSSMVEYKGPKASLEETKVVLMTRWRERTLLELGLLLS